MSQQKAPALRLNYRRTFLIGFAFYQHFRCTYCLYQAFLHMLVFIRRKVAQNEILKVVALRLLSNTHTDSCKALGSQMAYYTLHAVVPAGTSLLPYPYISGSQIYVVIDHDKLRFCVYLIVIHNLSDALSA